MTATFQFLRDTRLSKAVKAVELLQNLARYDHSEQEAKDLVNAISDAADDLDAVFAKKWGWAGAPAPQEPTPAPPRAAIPPGTADGGASFEAEVRWALDAIKRGDTKLAENRLKRILKGN
jgi:hypothetical protein